MNAMAGAGSRPRRCTPPRSPLADGPHLVKHPHGVGQHPDDAPLTLQGLHGASATSNPSWRATTGPRHPGRSYRGQRELPVARYSLQTQRDEHRSLAPANHRHRIHQPRRVLLDLGAQDAGTADRWSPGPLDTVGDRVPQARVADAFQLAGRSEPGLDLADGQGQGPGGGGRVGRGWAGIGAGLCSQGEFCVGKAGTEQRGGHSSAWTSCPGLGGRRAPVPGRVAAPPIPPGFNPALPTPVDLGFSPV